MVQVVARIALGRCTRCKGRTRVLPCDVLPRKTYGTSPIGHEVASHSSGNRSLRKVAWSQLGERTPAHTTLHGWSEGLGAHALGRRAGDIGGAPASRFLAEATAHRPGVAAAMRAEVHVDPRRYRSEARHERLVAVARLLAAVIIIAATLPHPFAIAECRRLALAWSGSSVLQFRSQISGTAIEHRGRSGSPGCRPTRATRNRCPTRTRSPPGATS